MEVETVIARIRQTIVAHFDNAAHGSNHRLRLLTAVPFVALALVLAGCGQSTTPTAAKTPSSKSPAATSSITIKTATVTVNGKAETVLTNSAGRTLYYFTEDQPTKIACSGSCAGIWPPLTTSASTVSAPSSVSGKFTIYKGANGPQVEYNGHPLYIYSLDTGPDQSHGEGVLGKWFVATPSLAPAAQATPSASPSASSGGYSY
jgi:predicted lipoprotein with Yx(FWY)xxD motif